MDREWSQPDHVSPTAKLHIQLDPSPNKRKKHKRSRLVLVTQDTNPVSSLESTGTPSKLPQKHKSQRSKKLWDTHSTKPQEPRPEDKGGSRGESALIAMGMKNTLPKDCFILYQTLGRRLLEPAVGIRAVFWNNWNETSGYLILFSQMRRSHGYWQYQRIAQHWY
jgi:hypothetical protein